MSERHGNTLLNIVIVVAILFVVGRIMLPNFWRPHACDGKPSCQRNLKEIGLAFNMYHGDYDNKLPSSALYNGSKTWNRDDFRHFTTELGQVPPPKNMTGVKKTLPMLLYPHLKCKDILWCDKDPNTKTSKISYWYKAASDYAWFNGCSKEGEYEQPSDQAIFYEHNSWHYG